MTRALAGLGGRTRELCDILVEDGANGILSWRVKSRPTIAERLGEDDRHAAPLVGLHDVAHVVADETGNAAAWTT